MKKILIPALALAAASVAVPAAAQVRANVYVGAQPAYGYGSGYGYDNRYDQRGYNRDWRPIQQRLANIDRRIDQGVRNGRLSRREAQSLQAELNYVARLQRSYQSGGLSARERRDIDLRLDRVEQRLRYERRDDDRRRW